MMKLVIDERVKHRLIGLAVILSIAAIFAPAIMKKSNQRMDGNMSVTVELPPKPMQPDVAMIEKNAMFENTKVAHVELPEVTEEKALPALAKAEPLSQAAELNSRTVEPVKQTLAHAQEPPNLGTESFAREDPKNLIEKRATTSTVNAANLAAIHKVAKAESFPLKLKPKTKVVVKNNKAVKPVVKSVAKPKLSLVKPKPAAIPIVKRTAKNVVKGKYAVQLATFSKLHNADFLISKLRGKGYQAIYNKVKTNKGIVYKVTVGQMQKREQAQLLQKKLASAVQIRGFIVTTDQG